MKILITLSALALASNVALAETFEYERQIGSQDLDPTVNTESSGVKDPAMSNSDFRISLDDWYRGNPDVEHVPHQYDGVEIKKQGDMFTSYDAWSRNNPDLEA